MLLNCDLKYPWAKYVTQSYKFIEIIKFNELIFLNESNRIWCRTLLFLLNTLMINYKLALNILTFSTSISQEHSPIPAARKMKDQTGINKDSKEMHKNYATTHKGVFSHLSVYKVKSTKNICSE